MKGGISSQLSQNVNLLANEFSQGSCFNRRISLGMSFHIYLFQSQQFPMAPKASHKSVFVVLNKSCRKGRVFFFSKSTAFDRRNGESIEFFATAQSSNLKVVFLNLKMHNTVGKDKL
jgi:hypothetical protein